MTSKERIKKVFNFEKPDRIPVYDMFQNGLRSEYDFDIQILNSSNVSTQKGKDTFNMLPLMDPFEDLSNTFGLEELLLRIGKNPEEVYYEFKKSTSKTLKQAGRTIAKNKDIDGIWLWADMAYNEGTFFSESFYITRLLPLHKEICTYFADRNMPVVLHSDGNLKAIMPYLIEAGFKGLHPVESQAGMGLEELNEKRDNMVFLGNFSLDLLRFKEMEDLRPILARKLDFAKDKGGYVFGFESPITQDIDLDKYQKVIEFVKEYGRYC